MLITTALLTAATRTAAIAQRERDAPVRVVVAAVAHGPDDPDGIAARAAQTALIRALNGSGRWTVVPADGEATVAADIAFVHERRVRHGRAVDVGLRVRVTDSATGILEAAAAEIGSVTMDLGYIDTDADQKQAITRAATQCVDALWEPALGVIDPFYDYPLSRTITVGRRNGVQVGTMLAVSRGSERLGTVRVITAFSNDAEVRIVDGQAWPGDRVVLLATVPMFRRADADPPKRDRPRPVNPPELFPAAHVVRVVDRRIVAIDRGFTDGVDCGLELVAGDTRLRVAAVRAHEADARVVHGVAPAPGDTVRPARPVGVVRGIFTNSYTGPGPTPILVNRGFLDGVRADTVFLVSRGGTLGARLRALNVFPDDTETELVHNYAGIRPEDDAVALVPLDPAPAR